MLRFKNKIIDELLIIHVWTTMVGPGIDDSIACRFEFRCNRDAMRR